MTSVLLQKSTFLIVRSTRRHSFSPLYYFFFFFFVQSVGIKACCGCSLMQLVPEPSETQPSCMFPRLSLCLVYVGFPRMHRLYRAILTHPPHTHTPGSITMRNLAIAKCIIENNNNKKKKKQLLGSISKTSPVLIIYHTVFLCTHT